MRSVLIAIGLSVYCSFAAAQWAVLDEEVRLLVNKIIEINNAGNQVQVLPFASMRLCLAQI